MIYTSKQQAELEIIYNKRLKPDSRWKIEEVRMPNAYDREATRYRVVADGAYTETKYG